MYARTCLRVCLHIDVLFRVARTPPKDKRMSASLCPTCLWAGHRGLGVTKLQFAHIFTVCVCVLCVDVEWMYVYVYTVQLA